MTAQPMEATTRNPARGRGVTPDWFEFHATGWICHQPHGPDVWTEELGHPEEWVNSYALAHLNTHHPGWKLPCSRCNTPQWNTEGRPTCFQCRR